MNKKTEIRIGLILLMFAQQAYSMEAVEQTSLVEIRKQILGEYLKKQEIDLPKLMKWNSDASMCLAVGITKGAQDDKGNILELKHYKYFDKKLSCCSHSWVNFLYCLPHDLSFINTQGDQYEFYGCGYESKFVYSPELDVSKEVLRREVFRYSVFPSGVKKTELCYLSLYKDDAIGISMRYFLNFPVLLKAIMTSSMVTEVHIPRLMKFIRLYHLAGVSLPENYTAYEKAKNKNEELDEYTAFEKLPLYIRGSLASRKSEQEK